MTLAFLSNETGLIVLVILVIVLFGGSQLPKIARNMGSAGREFRRAQEEAERDAEAKEAKDKATTPVPPPPSAVAQTTSEDKVTLSRTELDALLAEREARAKRESSQS